METDLWNPNDQATEEMPDLSSCRHCGHRIVWMDWSYLHPHSGEMDCRPLSRMTSAQPAEWDYYGTQSGRDHG